MLKHVLTATALLASTSFALAAEMDRGNNGSAAAGAGMSNSAGDHNPGHMKQGNSARDSSPGHTNNNVPSNREGARDHRSQSNAGHMNRNERNARDQSPASKNKRDAQGEKSSNRPEKNARSDDAGRKERNARSEDASRRGNQKRAEEHRGGAATGASEGTEGRSRPKGSVANVTTQQKTRIRTVFSHHHVSPVRNLGVAVNVGVAIPHSVHVYPMPEDIVTIVPDYRDYMYFMIDDDRVAIVDPDTYEIVDIIDIV